MMARRTRHEWHVINMQVTMRGFMSFTKKTKALLSRVQLDGKHLRENTLPLSIAMIG